MISLRNHLTDDSFIACFHHESLSFIRKWDGIVWFYHSNLTLTNDFTLGD